MSITLKQKIRIVTICGSMKFSNKMQEIMEGLENLGLKVFAPIPLMSEEEYALKNGRLDLLQMKPVWTKRHFEKILKSDAILIVNESKNGILGYFGPNTLMEMTCAFQNNKDIYLLNGYDDKHPFFEEIHFIPKFVLNGDIHFFVKGE